jgi:glycosyltransferase involved in cell wall biosynthesis
VEALWLWVGRKPGKADVWRPLEDLRRNNKHAEKIRFDGPTPDVLSYYHAADYLVLSSHNEGTPNVVLEAMSCGLPILSTAVGSVPSFVKPGVNGWLVPIKNPPALAEAMIGAMTAQQDVRRRMGQAARNTILARGLDWKGSAERLMHYYEELNTSAR